MLEAIKGVTRSNYGAPLILVVGCCPAEAWVRRYVMLAAENEGLDTLWVGSFDPVLLKGVLPGRNSHHHLCIVTGRQ